MTTRASYLALAERAERAEGADRDLDAEMFARVILRQAVPLLLRLSGWVEHDEQDECAPAFTASLDAALSLVPEGWRWSLDHTQMPGCRDCGRATLYAPGDGWTPADVAEIYAATPALALVAAALRARAEEAKDGE